MKFNNKELADLSFGEATIEGRLHHKKISGGYSHSVFKEKWFKLRANILFYFNLSETGQIFDQKPVGAFILENVIVQYEMNSEVPFSFSIYFNDEIEKKHLFSGRTQDNINKWVLALKQASYEYWRSQLILLQEKIKMITGQDPLLMYPRNAGCRHVDSEEPSGVPYNRDSKTKVQKPTFNSYITNDENVDSSNKKGEKSMAVHFEKQKGSVGNGTVSITSSPPVRPARGNKPKQERSQVQRACSDYERSHICAGAKPNFLQRLQYNGNPASCGCVPGFGPRKVHNFSSPPCPFPSSRFQHSFHRCLRECTYPKVPLSDIEQ